MSLDQFLPESTIQRAAGSRVRGDGDLDPLEVRLESIELFAQAPSVTPKVRDVAAPRQRIAANSSQVQIWPMLAAALVAMGVSMLALAAFAKIGHF